MLLWILLMLFSVDLVGPFDLVTTDSRRPPGNEPLQDNPGRSTWL